jgi:DNA anti-recombination protein RmuC
MKNHPKKTKTLRLFSKMTGFVAMIVAALVIISCGPSKEEKAKMEKLKEVKKTVTQDLEKINEDITGRIAYLDQEIEEATGELKEKLQEAKGVLIEQQNKVVKQINDIKDCCIDEWDDRIKQTSEAVKEIRAKTNETSKKVRELLDD